MDANRKTRNSKIPNKELEIPFDIAKLGSKDDPCFGKHYDLNADECQRCGDIEICTIATQQNLNILRGEVEENQPFKDITDGADKENERLLKLDNDIQKYVNKLKKVGKGPIEIKILTKKKFNLTKGEITKYL
jgi:hypothetical protein